MNRLHEKRDIRITLTPTNMSRRPNPRRALTTAFTAAIILFLLYLILKPSPPIPQDPKYGVLEKSTPESKVAIATFLCANANQDTEANINDDMYYVATRTLHHQLKHAPATRLNNSAIDFLVLVTHDVSLAKRERLTADGAKVVLVDDVPLPFWIKTGVTRWKDQFTKLRIFEMVEYSRILFIDADTLITLPIDGIFSELTVTSPSTTLSFRASEIKSDEEMLPAAYLLAARSDNALTGERAHPVPPPPTEVFSAGFWVVAPSKEMYGYLMSVMGRWRRFDPHTMEQSLLNYAFRRSGPMPWFELDWKWSATWPSERDVEGGVRTLHEKWWGTGPERLRERWLAASREMEGFYGG